MLQLLKYIYGTKGVDNKYPAIRSVRETGILELTYQHTQGMVLDIMTNPLPKPNFIKNNLKLL